MFANGRSRSATKGHSRRRVHFIGHEIAEYAIGGALIVLGLHFSRGLEEEIVLIGSLLIALNLCTKATLGVFKLVGRHLHHVFDYLIIVFAASAPVFGFVRHDLAAIFSVEAAALLLVFIEQSTRYVDPARPARAVRSARRVTNAEASTDRAVTNPLSPSARQAVRRVGFAAGIAKRVVQNRKDNRP